MERDVTAARLAGVIFMAGKLYFPYRRMADYDAKPGSQPPSMTSLIRWNITRVRKINPCLNLKEALRSTSEKLDNGSYEASSTEPGDAQERHLTCAVLAWRALGHTDISALYRLVTTVGGEQDAGDIPVCSGLIDNGTNRCEHSRNSLNGPGDRYYSDVGNFISHHADKVPVDTKLVMHVCEVNKEAEKPLKQTKQKVKKDLEKKIEAACCPDKSCAARLSEFDSAVETVRSRAARLARRDAQRAELLERAETAWRDLELGYQRRLQSLQEKEDDLNRQIKDLVEERNGYKKACSPIAEFLKERGCVIEEECKRLRATEKELSDCACQRHLLAEESTRTDNFLAEQHCRSVQQDRDLQFKEEQLRRKAASLRSALELQRALALEAERAARAEIASLRERGQATTDEVHRLETESSELQKHCNELRNLNKSLTSDLEERKNSCDLGMQQKVDELRDKSKRLAELKQKVIECRCLVPTDAASQVTRTASLVAFCRCEPGGDNDATCSCTSLRTRLLTDVLEGLFGGLHDEMAACATTMPCILLKCLEDGHDWERASVIRTRLTDYFSKLLSGELDIAIANYIERYRAKWVGAMCKSGSKHIGEQRDTMLYNVYEVGRQHDTTVAYSVNEVGRQHDTTVAYSVNEVGERHNTTVYNVHEVTKHFATQMFSNNLESPEKEYFINNNLAPRTLKTTISTATFAVQYPSRQVVGSSPVSATGPDRVATAAGASAHWRRTHQNFTQLRIEIEDLKKETIKKDDLKVMQNQLAKIMRKASNIFRLTSNNMPDNVIERKTCYNAHKPIAKLKEMSPPQEKNEVIISRKNNKADEVVVPQKKNINKVKKNANVVDQSLIKKMNRSKYASKTPFKNNYPQRFLFGKDSKSTSMHIMSDPTPNQKKQNSIENSFLDRIGEKEIESQNNCADNYASEQNTETSSAKEYDRLLQYLTKRTNAPNDFNITNNNNQKYWNEDFEKCSLKPVTENIIFQKNNNTSTKPQKEKDNKSMAYAMKSKKENVFQASAQKSLQTLSLRKQNAQVSLQSEKHVLNSSQLIKQNNSCDLPPANNVANYFRTNKKSNLSSLKKSENHCSENKANFENAFIETDTVKLEKTNTVTDLVSNFSKDEISCMPTSNTYTITDSLRNLLSTVATEETVNKRGLTKLQPDVEQVRSHTNDLDNKSLKTTFMKKNYSCESRSCICCSYQCSDEVQKLKNPFTFQQSFLRNSTSNNHDEICKPIPCTVGKTDLDKHHEEKELAVDWDKIHSLFYKYLDKKIKRLGCKPENKVNTDLIDKSSVPNVITKLCYMIKNDLNKIKSLPKSEKTITQSQMESSTQDNPRSLIVSNSKIKPSSNFCKKIRSQNISTDNNKSSNGKIATLTASCQVSGKIEMNNKSCLAVEKEYTEPKTVYDSNAQSTNNCKKLYVSCACSPTVSDRQCSCNILKGLFTENNIVYKKTSTNTNGKTSAHNVKESDKKVDRTAYKNRSPIRNGKAFTGTTCETLETENSANIWSSRKDVKKSNTINDKDVNNVCSPFNSPYFGCTVECTCDRSLGPCICTKGVLTNTRNEVEKLWKTAIDNEQKKAENLNSYVFGERRVTEPSKDDVFKRSEIPNDSWKTCHGHETCKVTSKNNLLILSGDISKSKNNAFGKNVKRNAYEDSRLKYSSLKNEIGISLSESLRSQDAFLPNINLGRHSTNSSLPVGKNIISEIQFWSRMLPEEMNERICVKD